MAAEYSDLKDRPVKDTICLFDVDGTLTPARLPASPEMLKLLSEVRHKVAIGFVCAAPIRDFRVDIPRSVEVIFPNNKSSSAPSPPS